jgi:hypothetical protein
MVLSIPQLAVMADEPWPPVPQSIQPPEFLDTLVRQLACDS